MKKFNARIIVKVLASSEADVIRCSVSVNIALKYGTDKKYLPIDTFILNKLMYNLPTKQLDEKDLNYLYSTTLAYLKFSFPKKIDLANYFLSCLLPEQIIKSVNDTIAQNTIFGWAVSGKMNIKGNASHQLNSYQISLFCDNSIVYPHASRPDLRDNSNVVAFDINSTYNDETGIRRHAGDLDSSKNENIRGIKPAPTLSPKRAL
ncbi:hypothetical protein NPIL_513801 [Nephila pilipes]|uniref:Uncharacterized protein n=1 Tax=Nephila pilipes TaxID=299642 RepID=A0A8X6PLD2_NEPPI|nr:hypothetical protein NPIL_513801 [Nephila pilipes]